MKGFIMITIREIAKLAGVSRGTVDRVLNNRTGVNAETSRIVKQIAEEHGYSPSAPGKMLAAKSKHARNITKKSIFFNFTIVRINKTNITI